MKASHAMRAAAKVRSQNTSTADTVTSMNTVNVAVVATVAAAGRRQRFFGHGELRLVILDILSRDDSHGYELIKAMRI
ncbi:transcriptional regulator [Escherichia coli]|nr:transcriptional regulator [Escherichia coli]